MVISQEYSIFSRSDISFGDHSSFNFSKTYCRNAPCFAILLSPFFRDVAAVFARWLADMARYSVLPLFRIISRATVLGDCLIVLAISRIDFFCASPRLISLHVLSSLVFCLLSFAYEWFFHLTRCTKSLNPSYTQRWQHRRWWMTWKVGQTRSLKNPWV